LIEEPNLVPTKTCHHGQPLLRFLPSLRAAILMSRVIVQRRSEGDNNGELSRFERATYFSGRSLRGINGLIHQTEEDIAGNNNDDCDIVSYLLTGSLSSGGLASGLQ
jgi:hypothetical protein